MLRKSVIINQLYVTGEVMTVTVGDFEFIYTINESLNHDAAIERCEGLGSQIASITRFEEHNTLEDNFG